MNKISENKAGLALGLFFGLVHLVWALFVAFGWAKPLMDWILHLHMMSFNWSVGPFSIVTAFWLVVVTFIAGYIGGWILAYIWNWAHKS